MIITDERKKYVQHCMQINPTLAFLMENMEGWYYERYVNILMYRSLIDYVDNVNYSGLIGINRSYSFDEIKKQGFLNIAKGILRRNNSYMTVWVDEYELPCSIRYKSEHFVHPLIIYGASNDFSVFYAIFFNINKGNIFVEICYNDLINALNLVRDYYEYGGTIDAICTSIMDCSVIKTNRGDFHLDVFIDQLNDYICSKCNSSMEWYTHSRDHLFDCNDVVYGIQIYPNLIKWLDVKVKNILIVQYKAIHDFIMHKCYMLDRFKYIANMYDVGDEYIHTVEKFEKIFIKLNALRLMNIKKQIEQGYPGALLCQDDQYIDTLKKTLYESYNEELIVLPQIYRQLLLLKYPKNFLNEHNVETYSLNQFQEKNGFYELKFVDSKRVKRIDIVKTKKEKFRNPDRGKIVINDKFTYYFDSNSSVSLPIQTINICIEDVYSIKLYTSSKNKDCSMNIFCLPYVDNSKLCLKIKKDICQFNQMESLNYDSHAMFKISGCDPYIRWSVAGIDANNFNEAKIRMKTPADGVEGQLFFATEEEPDFSQDKSFKILLNHSDVETSYSIRLSENPKWKGKLTLIRLDPVNYKQLYDNKTCIIYNVELVSNH